METSIRIPCPRCLRPVQACYCSELRPFDHPVKFVILQHPREARHRLGTGRVTHLCLQNSQLIRGFEFAQNPRFRAILDDTSRQPMVLYPGPRAILVTQKTSADLRESFRRRPATVLVIDGAWPQAKKMFRGTPELQDLPWISFETERRSEYKCRRQPDPLCLATIEAVHELIDALARCDICHPTPRGGHHNLVDIFRSMNDTQVRWMTEPTVHGFRGRPHRPIGEISPTKRRRQHFLFCPHAETDRANP